MSRTIITSAPGKLMLMGEHAVLCGHHCLACAIDQRVTVTLQERTDSQVIIESALGRTETNVRALKPVAPHEFVLEALSTVGLDTGCELRIESEFTSTLGLGSSAAVTAATVAAAVRLRSSLVTPDAVFVHGRSVIQEVQGTGSCADLAASVYGGVLVYRSEPLSIEPIADTLPLVVINSGAKDPTVRVVQQVRAEAKAEPEVYRALFEAMNTTSLKCAEAILSEDWPRVGQLWNVNHGLLEAIGVVHAPLARIVHTLREAPGILGAKVSGAGLGDCAIGLGQGSGDFLGTRIPLQVSARGVEVQDG